MRNELSTLFIGRSLVRLSETESTNRLLARLAAETNPAEGTIVASDYQTSGKGQAEAKWHSEPGQNLLMSVLLKPDFLSAKRIFLLSKIVSLAIKDTLAGAGIEAKVKWPNDIYAGDKKICGVLIENIMRGDRVQQSIVGIGLNVNQENFPKEIPNAVSMKSVSGKTFSADECLFLLCNHLEKWYLRLKGGHADQINKEYLDSLYRFGEVHEYETKDDTFTAETIDVEDEGRIVMRKKDGMIVRFGFKEVASPKHSSKEGE
jgi:BirA family biotin operon repressor/biotin-[acetyl-CoA-carboxylase] ligase